MIFRRLITAVISERETNILDDNKQFYYLVGYCCDHLT